MWLYFWYFSINSRVAHCCSQSQRTVQVGRPHWRLLRPTWCSKHGHVQQAARVVSCGGLNSSDDGDSKTSQQNLLQCSITLTVKYFLLCLNSVSCISVCAHCFLSWHYTPLKRCWLVFTCSCQVFVHIGVILNFHFSRLNDSSSLSVFYVRCSNLLMTFVTFFWPLSSMCLCLLYQGAQK